ncbi:hypothetical protein KCU73_g3723, partial [Aureobasidium melanogenum]
MLPDNCTRIGAIAALSPLASTTELENEDTLPGNVVLTSNDTITDLHHIILATGYYMSYPFLSHLHADNLLPSQAPDTVLVTTGQVTHNLHKDIFYIPDPTLAFIGVPYHVATFSLYEFQAMAVAEEAELLFKREIAEKESVSKMVRQAFQSTMMAKAQAAGAPPSELPFRDEGVEPHHLVKLIEENDWNHFGFVVFRTYFGDEALWEGFREAWDPILQYGFDMALASEGLERIRDKLLMKTVDDELTDGASAEGVASAYRLFTEDEDDVEEDEKLEPGLRTRMCLFVDQECMRSLMEPKAGTPPFVKAVDVELGSTTQQRPGATFKVAIKDLVTHFYPALF